MPRMTKAAKAEYLAGIANGLTETEAAALTGISLATFQRRRLRFAQVPQLHEPEFAAAYEEALETGRDALRAEIRRRAVEGVEDAKTVAGQHYSFRRYSDTLLMALANARLPEFRAVYTRQEQSPPIPEVTAGAIDLSKLTDVELDQLRELVRKARPTLAAVPSVA